jgi:single-strand DNA-binding protein
MSSRSVNKVTLLGRLGKDAESKFTPSGISVASFSIATSWRSKDKTSGEWKEHTDWHNIVYWRAENVAPYLLKGTQIYLEGRLQTRNYENREGRKVYVTEVVAEELILLGGKQDGVKPPAGKPGQVEPPFDPGDRTVITDDDVPF